MDLTPSKALRQNQHGLLVLGNGVVTQRSLEINQLIPSRTSDPDAKSLFGSKMTWSQVYTLFCLICGNIPVEKHRDLTIRKNIAKSAAPYALSTVQIAEDESLEAHVINAYLLETIKNALQKFRYYYYYLLLF